MYFFIFNPPMVVVEMKIIYHTIYDIARLT